MTRAVGCLGQMSRESRGSIDLRDIPDQREWPQCHGEGCKTISSYEYRVAQHQPQRRRSKSTCAEESIGQSSSGKPQIGAEAEIAMRPREVGEEIESENQQERETETDR
jgi:hypothetical protein